MCGLHAQEKKDILFIRALCLYNPPTWPVWLIKKRIVLMTKKSIYVAYTGGTIGMQRSEQGYIPVSGHLQRQLALMPEFHRPEMPDFHIQEYSPLMDSSDMTPEDWQHIADDIQAHYDQYDGFVILHGTDTMAFTASALSFMLENLGKPVIVTGSQIPLEALRSDGQINLLNSLYIAANHPVNEVTLFFNNRLYRGNRSTKAHADGFDAFASPNMSPLLEAGIHIRRLSTPSIPAPTGQLRVHNITPQPIGVVTIYPGISAEVVRNFLQQPVKALILRSYGVGNAPQKGDLLKELKEASERGIVVVNLTQCISGKVNMGGYATGNALAHAGVISGFDMTVEATLTKLHYLLSQSLSAGETRELMQQDLRGELTV
ncbi:asparaginase [Rouxiella silvae]